MLPWRDPSAIHTQDEARRIKENGGPKSEDNYNKIESPGKKLLEKEKEKNE